MSVSDYCQCARAITISNGGTTFCNITSNFGLCSISCSRRSADIIHHLVHGLRDNKLCGRRNAVWRTTNNLVIAKIVFIMQVLIFLTPLNYLNVFKSLRNNGLFWFRLSVNNFIIGNLFLVVCFITVLTHSPIVQLFSLKTFMSISTRFCRLNHVRSVTFPTIISNFPSYNTKSIRKRGAHDTTE